MTYGEAYTRVKLSLHMVDGEFVSIPIPYHKEQMNKDAAAKYYTKKIRNEFKRLGYEFKERVKYVEAEPQMNEFDKVEDYYDYFDATRHRDSLMVA